MTPSIDQRGGPFFGSIARRLRVGRLGKKAILNAEAAACELAS